MENDSLVNEKNKLLNYKFDTLQCVYQYFTGDNVDMVDLIKMAMPSVMSVYDKDGEYIAQNRTFALRAIERFTNDKLPRFEKACRDWYKTQEHLN